MAVDALKKLQAKVESLKPHRLTRETQPQADNETARINAILTQVPMTPRIKCTLPHPTKPEPPINLWDEAMYKEKLKLIQNKIIMPFKCPHILRKLLIRSSPIIV